MTIRSACSVGARIGVLPVLVLVSMGWARCQDPLLEFPFQAEVRRHVRGGDSVLLGRTGPRGRSMARPQEGLWYLQPHLFGVGEEVVQKLSAALSSQSVPGVSLWGFFSGRISSQQLCGLLAANAQLRYLDVGGSQFEGPEVLDDTCPIIANLTQLEVLCLDSSQLTDQGVSALRGLKELRELTLRHCSIKGDGLDFLEHLRHLRALALPRCKVSTSTLQHVARAENLERLSLHGTRVTDASMTCMPAMPHLVALDLRDCHELTEEGVAMVGKMTGLRELDLGNPALLAGWRADPIFGAHCRPGVASRAYGFLGGLKTLEKLSLLYTLADDSTLSCLATLDRLKHLDVRSCSRMTDAALSAFQKQHPSCRVLRD